MENTVGLGDMIHSEWEEGEESATGAVGEENRAEHERLRQAAGAGRKALEIRAQSWPSLEVCHHTPNSQQDGAPTTLVTDQEYRIRTQGYLQVDANRAEGLRALRSTGCGR